MKAKKNTQLEEVQVQAGYPQVEGGKILTQERPQDEIKGVVEASAVIGTYWIVAKKRPKRK